MKPRGFTLVELLVSLGVLSILLGLLLPSLSKVTGASRSLQCQSHLRQMTFAAHRYAAVWNAYPAAIRYDVVDGAALRIAWDWITTFAEDELVSPGPLWGFTDHDGRILQDPNYPGPPEGSAEPFTGFNYNTDYIGSVAGSTAVLGWDNVRKGVPPAQCRRTSDVAIFGCGGWSGGTNKFMRAPIGHYEESLYQENVTLDVKYAGAQAFGYNGCTNVAYLDGHVGIVCKPEEGERATDELLRKLRFPENGFLSPDDRAYDPR